MWNYVVRRNRAPMESDPNRGRRFLRFDGELSVQRLAALANTQCTNSPHPPPGGLPRVGSLCSTRFDGRAQGLDRRRAVLRPQAGLSPARAAACAASGPSLAKARWVTPTALFTLAAEPADSLRRMTLLLSRLWRFRFA